MKNITTTIFSILMITLSSCSEVTAEFKYMDELKKSITEKYETDQVELNIQNSEELIVSFTDPKFDHLSSAEKEQISREIGKVAQELRGDKEKIYKGLVNFRDEKDYGIARTSSTETFEMYE